MRVEELEQVAAQYPYFSAVQVLLARAYRDRNDHRFSGALHRAAAFTSHRRQLFELVRPGMERVSPPAVEVEEVKPAPPVELPRQELVITEPAVRPDRSGLSRLAEVIVDRETQIAAPEHSRPVAELRETATIQETAEPPVAQKNAEVQDEVAEQDIPAKDVEESDVTRGMDPMEIEIIAEAVSSSIELEVGQESSHVDEGAISAPANPNDAHSFSEWIYLRSKQLHYHEEDSTRSTALPEIVADESETTGEETLDPRIEWPSASISHGSTRIEPADKSLKKWELLEKFIQTEPKITPGRVSEYSTADLARESLEEDSSLVTETIARMYVAQGKPEKARRAYRKLMELYPEKSIYFAAQLKNVDKNKKT